MYVSNSSLIVTSFTPYPFSKYGLIVSRISLVITVPFLTITSPSISISWAILALRSLSNTLSFLLNLYLPTLPKSYLNLSKNLTINWFLAESNVAGSPGLNFSYISDRKSVGRERVC